MKKLGSRLLAGPYVLWMVLFTIIPLCLILYNAFTNIDGGFTLDNVAAITDYVNAKPLFLSLGMSLVVTLACFLLSFPLALVLSKYSKNKTNMTKQNLGLYDRSFGHNCNQLTTIYYSYSVKL